ncbi:MULTISPECIES: LacI family DNA-binding transcriptional regulator [Pseudomonas]|jgi:DNA-binding LacI/PurR family transcriptional regulator|uniref:LacI family DNA-binding transcriptional regulator n=2 Tax=Pseudomonas syringae TaxID=317 RepID=A0A8T8LZ12_PSESX|nr:MULTISPECIES: LacI family DNA-binding transcriptional regulator [Pseudomonas]ALD98936.1 LacI family transcription regulator [Pseudomonas syringae UMAF0158]ELQ15309.1 LacI transcriptional regulator [Pseudomonas syringae BRIP39023]KPB25006.1 LacI transcriptional regulator [Pseudomonas syringae pv. syringae]KPY24916.1 LacI transcriptional regulator [Pseudomonas syringae pv. papulans]KTB93520.1 transcriptional regulator [Pseudomonas syringae ICMP 11293]
MTSVKDVAKLAGVSLMTVSRALNDPGKLSPETYQRVRNAIDELQFVPSLSARRIRGDNLQTRTIGVFALDTATTPFAVELLLSIEQTAQQAGWNVFILNLLSNPPTDQNIDLMLSHRPDGLIFSAMGLRKVSIPQRLKSKPLVLANCVADDSSLVSYVPDDETGQYRALNHAFSKGYRRPLFINLPKQSLAWEIRQAGMLRACEAFGLTRDELLQYNLSEHDAYWETAAILARHMIDGRPQFDILICGNDRIAFCAYQLLLGQGLKIPGDVAVLGYDNMIGIAELFIPALTTVQLPYYEIGRNAARHLIESLEVSGSQPVDCPLVIRESL